MPLFSIAGVILFKAVIRNTQLEYLECVLCLCGWGSKRKENGKCTSAGAADNSIQRFQPSGACEHRSLSEKDSRVGEWVLRNLAPSRFCHQLCNQETITHLVQVPVLHSPLVLYRYYSPHVAYVCYAGLISPLHASLYLKCCITIFTRLY